MLPSATKNKPPWPATTFPPKKNSPIPHPYTIEFLQKIELHNCKSCIFSGTPVVKKTFTGSCSRMTLKSKDWPFFILGFRDNCCGLSLIYQKINMNPSTESHWQNGKSSSKPSFLPFTSMFTWFPGMLRPNFWGGRALTCHRFSKKLLFVPFVVLKRFVRTASFSQHSRHGV